MKTKINLDAPLDLVEVRRQLVAMRSLHAHDPRVTALINELIVKFAHLQAPEDLAHDARLRKIIANTLLTIEKVASHPPGRRY